MYVAFLHVRWNHLRGHIRADTSACLFAGLYMVLSFLLFCLFFAMQVSLVVNVASECGFTDQNYRALQQLQRDLGPFHFNVLAFPCNQFGQQEPDTNREIENFARHTYSVSFPMFSKIAVTGSGAHPAFKYLTRESCPFSSSLPGCGQDSPGQQKLLAGWVTFLFLTPGGK